MTAVGLVSRQRRSTGMRNCTRANVSPFEVLETHRNNHVLISAPASCCRKSDGGAVAETPDEIPAARS